MVAGVAPGKFIFFHRIVDINETQISNIKNSKYEP